MPRYFRFYMDDSGSRDPDHDSKPNQHLIDWFGLGGIIVDESEVANAKSAIEAFRSRWPEINDAPLHSYEIRNAQKSFRWLQNNPRRREFLNDLSQLMLSLPAHCMACVVHRPGYNSRYREKHGPRRWQLCNTAFPIAVERAAKYARHHGAKLRVYVERSDKPTEKRLAAYYESLKTDGAPFSAENSAKYAPLSASELRDTLYEFGTKTKASALMQIADLALWPICKGGYDPNHAPYRLLQENGKLLDSQCSQENGLAGIKYSCFDQAP